MLHYYTVCHLKSHKYKKTWDAQIKKQPLHLSSTEKYLVIVYSVKTVVRVMIFVKNAFDTLKKI